MRRHLGYSPAEVRAMDQMERRMWIEMLVQEFTDEGDGREGSPKTETTDDAASFGLTINSLS